MAVLIALAAGFVEVYAGPAQLNASATVAGNCAVAAPASIAADNKDTVANTASSLINVDCSSGMAYSVGVGSTLPASGVPAAFPAVTTATVTY